MISHPRQAAYKKGQEYSVGWNEKKLSVVNHEMVSKGHRRIPVHTR